MKEAVGKPSDTRKTNNWPRSSTEWHPFSQALAVRGGSAEAWCIAATSINHDSFVNADERTALPTM